MAERKRLELVPGEPKKLTLLSEAILGKNSFGDYQLYIVSNGNNEEYSFFCPNENVYEQLKFLKRGAQFEITKIAKQQGKGIKIDYEVKVPDVPIAPILHKDNYFDAMLGSYKDALKIQEELNGLIDVNRIAITLFIARSKVGSFQSAN